MTEIYYSPPQPLACAVWLVACLLLVGFFIRKPQCHNTVPITLLLVVFSNTGQQSFGRQHYSTVLLSTCTQHYQGTGTGTLFCLLPGSQV